MAHPKLFLIIIILFFSTINSAAQDNPVQKPQNNEVEELKKKVEEQQRQLKLMSERIEKQNMMVEHQQKQINDLITNKEQKPVVVTQTDGKTNPGTETADVKPRSQPTPKPASNVESGFGKIKFDGLLQAWYSAGTGTNNTLRFRRAEMKFSGQINPKVKWTLMIDPSKALGIKKTTTLINGVPVVTDVAVNQSSRILQDAFITLDYIKDVRVDIGQYKIPLTLEGLQSSATLDTIERALFMSDRSRGGGLGDIRDFGIQFSGPLGKNFDYRIGVFNGTGENANISDTNQEKAIIGRFVARPPFIKGLQIGASGAWSNSDRVTNPRRDRFGGDLLYTYKKFKFKTEVMGGVDGDIHRLGYYTHFGYKFTPKIEAIFRIDGFDPNRRQETNSSNVSELDYVGGLNYYIMENNVKFQFNYIRKTFNNGIQSPKNLILANLQTSW